MKTKRKTKKIDVAKKMNELINLFIFSKPFGDIVIPLNAPSREFWTENNANVDGFHFYSRQEDTRYHHFDEEAFTCDLE